MTATSSCPVVERKTSTSHVSSAPSNLCEQRSSHSWFSLFLFPPSDPDLFRSPAATAVEVVVLVALESAVEFPLAFPLLKACLDCLRDLEIGLKRFHWKTLRSVWLELVIVLGQCSDGLSFRGLLICVPLDQRSCCQIWSSDSIFGAASFPCGASCVSGFSLFS